MTKLIYILYIYNPEALECGNDENKKGNMGHPSFEPSSHPLRQLLAQTPQRLPVLDLKACKKLKLTAGSERLKDVER